MEIPQQGNVLAVHAVLSVYYESGRSPWNVNLPIFFMVEIKAQSRQPSNSNSQFNQSPERYAKAAKILRVVGIICGRRQP